MVMVEMREVPQHIAIIMDGNGRWAKERGENRNVGHAAGAKALKNVIEGCMAIGVKHLTVYAFSTENWGRSAEEVSGLMQLFCSTVESDVPESAKNGVRIRFMGERDKFNADVTESLYIAEEMTKNNNKFELIVALDYSSKREITSAVKAIASKVESGEMRCEDITDDTISDNLYLNDLPFPDMVIRTSGECRISNFMLWQIAYSELYFIDKLWPDFTKEDIKDAVEVYKSRDRRYGLVK